MKRAALVIAPIMALALPAGGQSFATASPLWQGINAGDSIAVVAAKLSDLPGIKSARARRDRVAISYQARDGIDILGMGFSVQPHFENGAVKKISLTKEGVCVGDSAENFKGVSDLIKEKYPETPIEGYQITEVDVFRAIRRATPEDPSSVSILHHDGQTAVMLVQSFSKIPSPPPPAIGATPAMRAATNFLWADYRRQVAECSFMGELRASYSITYMTFAEFEAASSSVLDNAEAEQERARSQL